MKLLNGLNRDVAHVDQPGGTYRDARNMIIDDLAGALATERAPEYNVAPNGLGQDYFDNMEICGQFKVPGDRVVIGVVARAVTGNDYWDTNKVEQILEIDQAGSTPIELAVGPTGTFGFDSHDPFQGVGYVNAADELILTWTNGVHKPYYVNTANYTAGDDPLLVFPEAKFPNCRAFKNSSNQRSGKILGGTWSFMMAYEVVSGTNNLTQYGPSYGAYKIGNDANDESATYRTSIKFKMYGVDTRYEYMRVYAVRNFNGAEEVYYAARIPITGEDMSFIYTGQDAGGVDTPSLDALYIPSVTYRTAETITVSDDRLFLANLTSDVVDFDTGQDIANNITVNWSVDEIGIDAASWDNIQQLGTFGTDRALDYTGKSWRDTVPNRGKENDLTDSPIQVHTDSQGMMGGFMPDEVYALYIAFLMQDGTWSRAFHIPGGGLAGDYTSTARLNTATVASTNYDIEEGAGTTNTIICGQPGYTENTNETYSNIDVFGPTVLAGGSDLRTDPVRHHLMPTAEQVWLGASNNSILNADFDQEWCNSMVGLHFDNVNIPTELLDKIQGFNFFYAKKTAETRRVKAYVPTWRWDSAFSTNQDYMRVYDPYLLSQQPAISGWSIKEVYKGMSYEEQLSHTMADATIDDFEYLPANVETGLFENLNREGCLALQISENLTRTTYDWHAGFPGYIRGQATEMHANSTQYAGGGYHSQIQYDTYTADYPERTAGSGIIADNFVSTFGSFQNYRGAATLYCEDNRPTKNNTTYGYVYAGNAASGGTYYNTVTGASVASGNLPSPVYHGWGGLMGSYSCLFEDMDDYHLNYEAQELVPMTDLVRVTTATFYNSNNVNRGGDVWITPVVVEFMSAFGVANGDPQLEDANDSTSYDELYKLSYFTWSPVLYEKTDIQQTLNWNDLVTYADAVSNNFNGETLNGGVIASHHFESNDNKSALVSREVSVDASEYPNRIIRSSKQNYESTQYAWGTYAALDYYDNALGKEDIRNLEDWQGELIIHHGNAVYKTRSKFNFDSAGTSVFVGTGDIFQAPPVELFPARAGYAGLAHWSDSMLCRAGYVWVDRDGKKIFMLNQGLEELSAKGMLEYVRDEFCTLNTSGMTLDAGETPTIFSSQQGGYTLGFDPEYDRILFTKKLCTSQLFGATTPGGETMSYSLRNQCWASFHTHTPYQYFNTYSKLLSYNEVDAGGTVTTAYGDNLAGIFVLNSANPGVVYDDTGAEDTGNETTCFVDVIFNMGGYDPKVWQSFNWVTRNGEGQGMSHDDLNTTFDRARVFNDTQLSQWSSDFRRTDNRFNFNEFRDDAKATLGTDFIVDATHEFAADGSILDLTKSWYQRGRFISDYATIRLEALNSDGNMLYLLDVGARARLARR